MNEIKCDMTPAINDVIDGAVKNKVVNTKEIRVKYHTTGQLYTRTRVLFRVCTALCPELAFKSLKHFDEKNDSIKNFNDDFIVGVYTPKGPISFHFKLEFLDEFAHIPFSESSPKYDGYTEEEMIERLENLADEIIAGKDVKEILKDIIKNNTLDESQKPKQLKKEML